MARKGFRGYPVGTIAFYGPTGEKATKAAVGIVLREGAEPEPLRRWFSEDVDVRSDPRISREILDFLRRYGVRSVVMSDGLLGCPHEEGVHYPEGEVCPECPYWADRDRWTGERIP